MKTKIHSVHNEDCIFEISVIKCCQMLSGLHVIKYMQTFIYLVNHPFSNFKLNVWLTSWNEHKK